MRPSTAASSSTTPSRAGATGSAGIRWRPQSAGETAGGGSSPSPVNRSRSPSTSGSTASKSTSDKANSSSDQLIRDLEQKVRKVVEQKRAESDKLRFAVAKKRDDVEKAKRILQDLLKDSDALGLHYDLSEIGVDGPLDKLQHHQIQTQTPQATLCEEDSKRLQPVASISRRPVYSKHTNIHELEAKLERCAHEAHVVQRRTLVLDHIKKRLLTERIEVAQSTKQLKQVFGELTHETQELQKREIAAAEAVSHVQLQLAQQKQDMAASVANFKRELALRQKWAREKKKFEKYYNDQLQAVAVKAAQVAAGGLASSSTPGGAHVAGHHQQLHASGVTPTRNAPTPSPMLRRGSSSPLGILKHHRRNSSAGSSTFLQSSMAVASEEDAIERAYRDAFRRIGVDTQDEGIDPEEIIRICLSHEELRKELDAKHDEAVERIATLRDQINKARSVAREDVPLSKRGTSQKIETKQLEISTVERQLATVVDQYMFVEHAVRPIKIGLQQVLQNVSSATVNIDNMTALENCLVDSCEEMMRMVRVSSVPLSAATNGSHSNQSQDGKTVNDSSGNVSSIPEEHDEHSQSTEKTAEISTSNGIVPSLDSFTSPYNVRIVAKKREPYYVPGLVRRSVVLRKADEDEELDEDAFEVMDRAMVKRVSSVVMCTSATKKSKEKPGEGIK